MEAHTLCSSGIDNSSTLCLLFSVSYNTPEKQTAHLRLGPRCCIPCLAASHTESEVGVRNPKPATSAASYVEQGSPLFTDPEEISKCQLL